MKLPRLHIGSLLIPVALAACDKAANLQHDNPGPYESEEFKNYWYRGYAEVSSYNLDQARYGENHRGKAMLIFVTEGFSKKKQVKLDDPDHADNDKLNVMKLNYTKNFVTGIYPYSMMLSSFTPIRRDQNPNTLKVTMTSQEWCGHVFSQMNLKGDKYEVAGYSYFEQESDSKFNATAILLEDELFNLIRIDPENIPQGKIKILPGLFFTRLKHDSLKPQDAILTKSTTPSRIKYVIEFPERVLTIHAEDKFPHKILSWQEESTERGKKFVTKAILDKTLYTDYWRKNKNEFAPLRDSLGLSGTNY